MDAAPGFGLLLSQSEYLSTEDDKMHAALVVTATGATAAGPAAEVAQVIAIDCSGSMSYPQTKIAAARRATKAAVDALRDGALFAVIEGTQGARQVYPARGLVRANAQTRRAAKAAVQGLSASGGTAIGEWLRLARTLLGEYPLAVRHVILLTDGQNNQSAGELDRVLASCRSEFSCDARGIGTDWAPQELLRIAEALHGTADAIRKPADLAADFTAMTGAAMEKVVPELRIVVKTMARTTLDFVRQRHPAEAELHGERVDERTTWFGTGSWGAESREYHLRLTVDSTGRPANTNTRIARVDLEVRAPGASEFSRACDPATVLAHWTDDLDLSSRIDPKIAHFTGQTELREAVLAGSTAHERDDLVTAAAEWGTAVRLATELGNERVLVRLRRLVDIEGDPANGVVRVKAHLAVEDLLSMAVGSTLSSMSPASSAELTETPPRAAAPAGPAVECPNCKRGWPAGSVFCGGCGTRLGA
ncbi:VWA domain-containing protein [Actinokineospora sp. NBRC 105648]|uniref:VWA domain-containing protein n=1 Tax=Actinokineospora sp. NBRC 105648 TaxID=3032206 RepID=UPI0024A29F77|nr:VWA domain-containing protein [Actinokineospora sp. NBRC 105648]GLZ40694.1 hypothetical protein Acsp05_43180 [Actinokineospora sp. NBRC 105648]